VVSELRVRDGSPVRRGEVLLSLDVTEARTEHARLDGEHRAESLQLAGALAWREVLAITEPEPAALSRALDVALGVAKLRPYEQERVLQRELLGARHAEFSQRLGMLARRDAALAAERRSAEAEARRLDHSLPVLREQREGAAALAGRGLIAREQFLARDLAQIGAEQQLAASREHAVALGEQRAALLAERSTLVEGEHRAVMQAIETHQRRVQALAHERERLAERIARAELRAPIDGTVQQLAVRGAGAVVRAADPLLLVVPRDAPLEIEAWVLDRDIGFVGTGQEAAVKVDAFDFTRYGLLAARVRALAPQAIEHERLGAVYAARITLDRNFFQLGQGRAALVPGMAVQVEIRTGRRRIIEYFLSPIARVASDSIRER
jgi:hemolysin D